MGESIGPFSNRQTGNLGKTETPFPEMAGHFHQISHRSLI
jgi:hypothetical protein